MTVPRMRLKTLDPAARVAVSLFAVTVLGALLSALVLMQYASGSKALVDVAAIKAKYTGALIVSAMWGPMYKHVTEDASIEAVERWIAGGRSRDGYQAEVAPVMEEDCTNCHSRTSTMTDAAPGLPLTSYEDVLALSQRGLPPGKLERTLHVHLFGLATALLLLSLMLAASDLRRVWRILLPLGGFLGLWMDTSGWILGRFGEWAVWFIIGGGSLMSASLGAMAGLVLLDCWFRIPLLSRAGAGESPAAR